MREKGPLDLNHAMFSKVKTIKSVVLKVFLFVLSISYNFFSFVLLSFRVRNVLAKAIAEEKRFKTFIRKGVNFLQFHIEKHEKKKNNKQIGLMLKCLSIHFR